MKRLFGLFIVTAIVLAGAGMAFAFGSFLTDPVTGFNAVYPAAGAISTCSLCHTDPAGGGARNSYGSDWESAAIPGHTTHVYDAALEALDSDGDTFSNITEINASPSTYPGDPASHPALPSAVTVTSPNGGEVVPAGSTTAITYTFSAGVASVKVKLSLDNGLTWSSAADAGSPVLGTFNWAVPTPKKNKTKVLVKVIGYAGPNWTGGKVGADRSDTVFTIETLTITAPAALATVSAPSTVITWTTNGVTADRFVLFYSLNNGLTWKKIFDSGAGAVNPGTYTWDAASLKPIPTPLNPKPNSRIRLVLKDNAGVTLASDISDKFTIQ